MLLTVAIVLETDPDAPAVTSGQFSLDFSGRIFSFYIKPCETFISSSMALKTLRYL